MEYATSVGRLRSALMLDPALVHAWGFPGLFTAAFLAGSVFPVPSEAVLAALVAGGAHPGICIALATVGNVLGALTLYALGRWAAKDASTPVGRWIAKRRAAAGPRYARGERWLQRWGGPILVLSWFPIIGDVFVLAAGAVGIRWPSFVVFTALGKGARYLTVAASIAALI